MPRLIGEQHPAHKLTADMVREIRDTYIPGVVTYDQLAAEYGVRKQTIAAIISGRAWKHVTE